MSGIESISPRALFEQELGNLGRMAEFPPQRREYERCLQAVERLIRENPDQFRGMERRVRLLNDVVLREIDEHERTAPARRVRFAFGGEAEAPQYVVHSAPSQERIPLYFAARCLFDQLDTEGEQRFRYPRSEAALREKIEQTLHFIAENIHLSREDFGRFFQSEESHCDNLLMLLRAERLVRVNEGGALTWYDETVRRFAQTYSHHNDGLRLCAYYHSMPRPPTQRTSILGVVENMRSHRRRAVWTKSLVRPDGREYFALAQEGPESCSATASAILILHHRRDVDLCSLFTRKRSYINQVCPEDLRRAGLIPRNTPVPDGSISQDEFINFLDEALRAHGPAIVAARRHAVVFNEVDRDRGVVIVSETGSGEIVEIPFATIYADRKDRGFSRGLIQADRPDAHALPGASRQRSLSSSSLRERCPIESERGSSPALQDKSGWDFGLWITGVIDTILDGFRWILNSLTGNWN